MTPPGINQLFETTTLAWPHVEPTSRLAGTATEIHEAYNTVEFFVVNAIDADNNVILAVMARGQT
jgi:hypothetical protein